MQRVGPYSAYLLSRDAHVIARLERRAGGQSVLARRDHVLVTMVTVINTQQAYMTGC